MLDRHGGALRRIAASYERNPSGREDLMQDIVVALLKALPRFRGDSALSTFVYRVATNQAIDHLARRTPAMLDLDDARDVPDAQPGPEYRYQELDQRERLLTAVHALPLSLRQVTTLLLEDLSHAEIADVLGITENNVAVRANRGRARLRELLNRDQ